MHGRGDHSIEDSGVAERDSGGEVENVSALVDDSSPLPPDAPQEHPSGPVAEIEQHPLSRLDDLRRDFEDHFRENYRRLVAQLYAITLSSREAHDAVQDAYSRAWRRWAQVGAAPDPSAWIRRVAVRSTIRSWRRVLRRRPRPSVDGVDQRTGMLLVALSRMAAPERRCAVLHHMAGVAVAEIAVVEGVPVGTTRARLRRAEQLLGGMLPELSGRPTEDPDDDGDEHGEWE